MMCNNTVEIAAVRLALAGPPLVRRHPAGADDGRVEARAAGHDRLEAIVIGGIMAAGYLHAALDLFARVPG